MVLTTDTETWRAGRWKDRSYATRELIRLAWAELLSRVLWQLFVTLTFNPTIKYAVSRRAASAEAFGWCCDVERSTRTQIPWAYAVERHRSGRWHAHALVAGIPAYRLDAANGMWAMRNGLVDVRPVTDSGNLTLYTTKQLALDGELVWTDGIKPFMTSGTVESPIRLSPEV